MFYIIVRTRILKTARFIVVYPSLLEASFVTYEDDLLAALLDNYLG